MNEQDFHSLSQQPTRYWYQDGLTEILMALISFLLALYFYLETILPPGSFLNFVLIFLFIGLIMLSSRFVNKTISRLKERITYPRTGYVSYRKPPRQQHIWQIISSVLMIAAVFLMVVLLYFYQGSISWMPAITGCLLGIFMLILIAPRTGALRFYLLGIGSICLGIGISLIGLENLVGLFIYYLVASFGLLCSGVYTLVNYIRENPIPSGEMDE